MSKFYEDDFGNMVDLSEVVGIQWKGVQPIVAEGWFHCYRLSLRNGGSTEVKVSDPDNLKRAMKA